MPFTRFQQYLQGILLLLFYTCCIQTFATSRTDSNFYHAGHPYIRYTGRVDYTDSRQPKFWAPGVYLTLRFHGTYCIMEINDEEKWGKSHNYLQVILDNKKSYRIQLIGKNNKITLASGLKKGNHTLLICKNTEAEIGFLQPVGFICSQLRKPPMAPERKIEFYGNSITCGMGNDDSIIPCKSREWYDQHNAYMAYGPMAARQLKAQWQLTSVSGIGLIRSCCNKTTVMPQVFDKINMAENKLDWNFNQYQPDVVSICLGQNDGKQDSTAFCSAYTAFIGRLRSVYPDATIVLLNSPMADQSLDSVLKKYILATEAAVTRSGDLQITHFFYSQRYYKGCDAHPDMKEHEAMAKELAAFLRKRMGW